MDLGLQAMGDEVATSRVRYAKTRKEKAMSDTNGKTDGPGLPAFCESCAHWSPRNKVDGECGIAKSLPADVPQGWLTKKTFGCVRHSQNDKLCREAGQKDV